MGLSLFDATVGTLTSTSYIDVARFIVLRDQHVTDQVKAALDTAFPDPTGADEDKLQRNLMLATSQLDNSYHFIGRRATEGNAVTTGQRLKWGRSLVPLNGFNNVMLQQEPFVHQHHHFNNNVWFFHSHTFFNLFDSETFAELPKTIIPFFVEMSVINLVSGFTVRDRAADSNLNEIKQGALTGLGSVTFRDELPSSQGTIPSNVDDWLRDYGILRESLNSEGSGITSRKILRG